MLQEFSLFAKFKEPLKDVANLAWKRTDPIKKYAEKNNKR
jgi:hypothetical protein